MIFGFSGVFQPQQKVGGNRRFAPSDHILPKVRLRCSPTGCLLLQTSARHSAIPSRLMVTTW